MPAVKPLPPPAASGHSSAHALDGVRVLVLFGGERLLGQERGNIEVFRALKEWGLEARFITSSKWGRNEIQPALDRFGLRWVTAPFGYQWGSFLLGRQFPYFFVNLYGMLATTWRVLREARRWRATHLYVPGFLYFSYAAPAILLLPLPLIWRAGDVPSVHSFFHRWLLKTMIRRGTQIVCISKFIERSYVAVGLAQEKTRVIYNYPPTRALTRSGTDDRKSLQAGDSVSVLYIGQIAKFKGVGVLVEAVAKLVAGGRDIHLWIAGGGHDDDEFCRELDARIMDLELQSRVHRVGFVEDVAALLQKADIHVCPSMCSEALGNVVVEAKAEGVPSVVFPDGGLPELIEHGVDGYVCRECSAEALAEGLEFFLADAARRERGGAAARRSLEVKFGFERFRQQWAEVFLSTRCPETPPGTEYRATREP